MQREALIAALERLEFTADYYDAEIEDAKRVYKPHRIPGWESERAKHEAAVAKVKTALAAPAPEPVAYGKYHPDYPKHLMLCAKPASGWFPLYATPPAAAPAPKPVTYICLTAEEQAAMHKALGRSVKVVETSDTAALQARITKLEGRWEKVRTCVPAKLKERMNPGWEYVDGARDGSIEGYNECIDDINRALNALEES
jgi:hypothetical protein